jgi:hypothetical protein
MSLKQQRGLFSFFIIKKLPLYTLEGFDITTLNSGLFGGRGQFFKQIFPPTEKLTPTGKVGALATLGLAQFEPMH